MRWICSIWLFVLLGTFGDACAFVSPMRLALSPAISFAYDGYDQSTPAYDGRLESTSGYDAVLEPITDETRNETTENRVLFAKFAKILAAKTTAGASDDVVRLFHQGNLRGGQVSGTRALSTSPTSDLLHYNPQGQLFEFQVPRSTLNQWEQQGLMMRLQDLHAPSGIITPEIRILPPASEQMNQFIIKPPGG